MIFFCAQFNQICHSFLILTSLSYFGGKVAVVAISRAIYWLSSSWTFWGLMEKIILKKVAVWTAELLQHLRTSFQRKWRLCGSVVEALQRPLWGDWFFCPFGPYNWLGRTQAHVHSHTNTLNVSLERRNKGKKESLLCRNESGSDWLIVLANTRWSVLSASPLLHLHPHPHHHHHSPCTPSALY